MIETLQRSGRLDPDEFWRLPPFWRDAHLAHTRNLFTGAYEPPQKGRRRAAQAGGSARAALDVERWRAEREQAGPSARDVEEAHRLLRIPGLPAALRAAAEDTIRLAGVDQ